MKTDLSTFNNAWYRPGPAWKRGLWYVVGAAVFASPWCPFSGIKVRLLRWFGARVGRGVVLKPRVTIKYPWLLTVGDRCWIGEGVWIDNLAPVVLGSDVCVSQGALLLTGNHDWTKPSFDLVLGAITLEDGVWVGARALVCPGAVLRTHAVLSAGSVAGGELEAYGVYRGHPAVLVRRRVVGA